LTFLSDSFLEKKQKYHLGAIFVYDCQWNDFLSFTIYKIRIVEILSLTGSHPADKLFAHLQKSIFSLQTLKVLDE